MQLSPGTAGPCRMRLLNVVVAGLMAVVAIVFGLVAALVVATTTAIVVLVRRLRGASAPQTVGNAQSGGTGIPTRARDELRHSGETIDVTATEVPADARAAQERRA